MSTRVDEVDDPLRHGRAKSRAPPVIDHMHPDALLIQPDQRRPSYSARGRNRNNLGATTAASAAVTPTPASAGDDDGANTLPTLDRSPSSEFLPITPYSHGKFTPYLRSQQAVQHDEDGNIVQMNGTHDDGEEAHLLDSSPHPPLLGASPHMDAALAAAFASSPPILSQSHGAATAANAAHEAEYFVLPNERPSSFHTIIHFLLRSISLACLLMCAMIRINIFGFIYLLLFFFSIGLIAFKRFNQSSKSVLPRPLLSPLMPFVLPGFLLSLCGLLAMSILQLMRHFDSSLPLDGEVLREFGMSYTEPADSHNISVLFVPYLLTLLYFCVCLFYLRWKVRCESIVNRTLTEKHRIEDEQLAEFQLKHLDTPLIKLDILTKDPKEQRWTRDKKKEHEQKIRAKYSILLTIFLKKAKSSRRTLAALHKSSSKWNWYEYKVFNPLLHFSVFLILLLVGILERSILSYVYYFLWSVIIVKWAIFDRPTPGGQEEHAQTNNTQRTPRRTPSASAEVELAQLNTDDDPKRNSFSATVPSAPVGVNLSDPHSVALAGSSLVEPPAESPSSTRALHRRATNNSDTRDAIARMEQGRRFTRYFRNESTGKTDKEQVTLFYVRRQHALYWSEPGTRLEKESSSLRLSDLSDVFLGKRTPVLMSPDCRAVGDRCFSLVTNAGVCLDLESDSVEQLSAWLLAIQQALTHRGGHSYVDTDPDNQSPNANKARTTYFVKSPPKLTITSPTATSSTATAAATPRALPELSSSLFTAYPTYDSFPLRAHKLPIFRFYLFLWLYTAAHLLLKYVMRGLYIFDIGSDVSTPLIRDLTGPDVSKSHLLFYLGEYSLPTSQDGSTNMYTEEGFHLGLLFTLNLLLGVMLHLSRKPYVYLPISFGSRFFREYEEDDPNKKIAEEKARTEKREQQQKAEAEKAQAKEAKRQAAAAAQAQSKQTAIGSSTAASIDRWRQPLADRKPTANVTPASPSPMSDVSASPRAADGAKLSSTPTPLPPPVDPRRMTPFQHVAAFLGRSLWFFFPTTCFLLAILYQSYPGITYLLFMVTAAYFSIHVSIQLLPFALLYTLGINHAHYIFHLVNSYWDDDTGSEYLTNITISTFVALMLSSFAVGYFACAHRYAHRAILFWESFHGFAASSLMGAHSVHSPLGLLSPRLGHHEVVMKQHKKLIEERLKQWRAEDARVEREEEEKKEKIEQQQKDLRRKQKERFRRETLSPVTRGSVASASVGNLVDPSPSPASARLPRSRLRSPSSVTFADMISVRDINNDKEGKEEEEKRQTTTNTTQPTPQNQTNAAPKSTSPTPPYIAPSPSASSPSGVSEADCDPSVSPSDGGDLAVRLSELNAAYHDSARRKARAKFAAHPGFNSTIEYAAAQIQAAYRGRKARAALSVRGLHVVPPVEVAAAATKQREEKEKQHRHHHRHKSSKRKRELLLAAAEEDTGPSCMRRFGRALKSGFTTFSLFLFSYSNMVIMVLLYIIGILRIDIIHGVYMLLFLSYAISPWMRKHHGIVVLWSSLVIISEYLWNLATFRDETDRNNTWTDRVGLVRMFPYNQDLYPHIAILFLSSCFHRFSPEEAAEAQLHLNRMDEEARITGKSVDQLAKEPPSPEYLNRAAYSAFWYSPYRPFYRTLVSIGMCIVVGVTLWAGMVNSLMTSDTVNEDDSNIIPDDVRRNIGVSLISGMYLLFVFAILLVHQFRPGLHAYPYDRAILFMMSIYSGSIVCLQYVYQFGVLDSSMSDLADRTNYRFSSAEIGIFRTPGSLYRSLLSHSIVLFLCVAQLRILRMDIDPVTRKSISGGASSNGTIENLLESIEEILTASESRLKRASFKKAQARVKKESERLELAALQKRKIEAFELKDFDRLHAEFCKEKEIEEARIKEREEATIKKLKKKRQTQFVPPGADSMTITEAAMRRRSVPITLLIHFFSRIAYYMILFFDWFILQHTDKLLALTLFLVAITHINLMGAWYVCLAFMMLLLLGYPRLKATLVIVSSQLFITMCFIWQFPLKAFDQDDVEFAIIGLNKDSSFGSVAFHHLAVMLMAAFYGTTFFWLRIHQRKTVAQTQIEEFEAFQEKMMQQRQQMEMNKQPEPEPEAEPGDDEDAAEMEVAPANSSTPHANPPSAVDALLESQQAGLFQSSTPVAARRTIDTSARGLHTRSPSGRPRALPLTPRPPQPTLHATSPLRLNSATVSVMPALLSSLPTPSIDAATSAAPIILTPEQHSSVVLYNHLQSRLFHTQYASDHAHPSSRKDDTINDLQNMNLDILLQNNVGPSERKGMPRYQPKSLTACAGDEPGALDGGMGPSPSLSPSPSPSVPVASPRAAPNVTFENSNSDNEEDPLRHVKSWMMTVPLAEHSHRLSREKKIKQRMRAEKLKAQVAQREATSNPTSPAPSVEAASPRIEQKASWPFMVRDTSLSVVPASSPTAAGAPVDSSAPVVELTSPTNLTEDALRFGLASSAVEQNQVDSSVKQSSSLAVPLDVDGGDGMNRSAWHRFFRGLMGDEGLFAFAARFGHYFGFFHLALISLLCASHSNANTLFSLYYIIVTGLLSYFGTQSANRRWRPLVASLTLCIIAKYAIALANITPEYRCEVDATNIENECSRWIIWVGKGTSLYYWDVVAWLMVVIHFSYLRIYALIEQKMQERKRVEREEPWELKTGGAYNNPIERAAYEGAAEGCVETFQLDEDDSKSPGTLQPTNALSSVPISALKRKSVTIVSPKDALARTTSTSSIAAVDGEPKVYHRFSANMAFAPITLKSLNLRKDSVISPTPLGSASPPSWLARTALPSGDGSNDLPGLFEPSQHEFEQQLYGTALPSTAEAEAEALLKSNKSGKKPVPSSGFPNVQPSAIEVEPIPTYLTITYTTINNQLSSYLISNFMASSANSMNETGNTVNDYMHFMVFRGFHFFALLLIMCLATTYFNLISFLYLAVCLLMLWEGDRILDGSLQYMWDHFYILVYVVIFLRLLYQLPIFGLVHFVTGWSTVFGFYKATLDDCLYRDTLLGTSDCIVTPYTAIIPKSIVIDILIFAVILVVRTLLSRKEMVFVRHYIKEQRKVSNIRSELISLQLEHDRLSRTWREKREAIGRLERVMELKRIKIEREMKLEQERIASGQMSIIAGWEDAGMAMGIAASKKSFGQDEDAMARASIRNHAIDQIKSRSLHMIDQPLPPPRPKAIDAPLPTIGRDTRLKPENIAKLERMRKKQDKQQAKSTAQGDTIPDGGLDDVGATGAKPPTRAPRSASATGAATVSGASDRGVPASSGNDTDSKPLLAKQPSQPHSHHHSHHHSHQPLPDASTAFTVDPNDNPQTLTAALRNTVFELQLVESRMKKLRNKKSIERLNRDDELPLLLLKLYELPWVQSLTTIFSSSKYAIFKDERLELPKMSVIDEKERAAAEEQRKRDKSAEEKKKKEEKESAKKATTAQPPTVTPQAVSPPVVSPPARSAQSPTPPLGMTPSPSFNLSYSSSPVGGTSSNEFVTDSRPHDDPNGVPRASTAGAGTPDKEKMVEMGVITWQWGKNTQAQEMPPSVPTADSSSAMPPEGRPVSDARPAGSSALTPPNAKSPPAVTLSSLTSPTPSQDRLKSMMKSVFEGSNDWSSDDEDDDSLAEPSLMAQVWELCVSVILRSTWMLVGFFFLLEYLVEPSLLTVIYPFSLFLYGLLTYPRPPRWFWEAMIVYTSVLIMLRFLFQFPCFCVCNSIYGQSYSLCAYSESQSCSISAATTIASSTTSLEDIIGLKKFGSRDSAQAGRFMRFVGGAILDFFTLFILLFHRRHLRIHGLWLSAAEVDLRQHQHEHLMARLVKTAVTKERVKEWRQEQDDAPSDAKHDGAKLLKSPRDAHTNQLLRQKSLKQQSLAARGGVSNDPGLPDSATSVAFIPIGHSNASVAVEVDDLQTRQKIERHQAAMRTPNNMEGGKEYTGRLASTKKKPNMKSTSSHDDSTQFKSAIAKGKPIKKLPRYPSVPSAVAPAKLKLEPLSRSSTVDASVSVPTDVASPTNSFPVPPSPISRRANLFRRVSSMFSRGKSKLLHTVGEVTDTSREASAANSENELAAGETSRLLAGERPHRHSARSDRDMARLERARLKARKKLAKQVSEQRELRLQRQLRRMSQSERREALNEAKKIQEKADAREQRHQAHMKQRMKLREQARVARNPPKENWFVLVMKWIFHTISDTTYKPGKDFYIYIFLVQLIQFIVLVIFYNLSDSAGSLSQNYISPEFVLVIFAQFVHIVVERVIYLYRQLFCKMLLQIATMITFFIISLYLGLGSSALLNVVYVLMCLYWILSGLQYYHGYPASTQGQFFAKSTHWLPAAVFSGYRAIPFVFELRTLLDWLCTDTVLYFPEWLKFEDIYATFFMTQCKCDKRRNNPVRAGTKQKWWSKLLIGLGLFIVLVIVVWGPLFLFSSQSATSPNPVLSSTVSVAMPGYTTLYSSSQSFVVASPASGGQQQIDDTQYATLVQKHSFLRGQRQRGLQIIYPLGSANPIWSITPMSRVSLIREMLEPVAAFSQDLLFTFSYTRSADTAAPNTNYQYRYQLTSEQRFKLAMILNGTNIAVTPPQTTNSTSIGGRRRRLFQSDSAASNRTNSLYLPGCFPSFFFMSSIDSSGSVDPLSTDASLGLANCLLTLVTAPDQFGVPQESWLLSDAGSFGQIPTANLAQADGTRLPTADNIAMPQAITASETYATDYDGIDIGPPVYMYSGEIPSGNSLNLGLVGVYVTVVLAIGRFLRMYVMGTSKSIMYDDLQDALPVLNMCRDLYTARLHMQLKLEQQLYVELINLLRSPETLLARTGEFIHYFPKDGTSEEDADSYSDADDTASSFSSYSSTGSSSSSSNKHSSEDDDEPKHK